MTTLIDPQDPMPTRRPRLLAVSSPADISSFDAGLGDDEAQLLGAGLPVALPVGDRLPELDDPSADVHEQAVTNIQTGALYKHLREMPRLEARVVRLVWGIGCRPHSHARAAEKTGI